MRIPNLTELARRRLARTTQVEALPPQPQRYNVNPHSGWRVPVMHGYYGSAALRYGYEPPALRAIRDAALAQGVDPDAVAALTLDQVIVLPDGSLSATVGGATVVTRWQGTARAPTPDPGIIYERTGHTDVATMSAITTGGTGSETWTGLHILAPVVLLSFTLTGGNALDTNESVWVEIDPIGRVYNSVIAPTGADFAAAGGGQLGRWVTSGIVIGRIGYNFVNAIPKNIALTLIVAYEHLRQRA